MATSQDNSHRRDNNAMKDLPPLQWLRAFEASARHLSFTSAATELNVTQSAVSQQIKLLENYLGQALFIRRPRSLQLSDCAVSYLPDIQAALSQLRKSTDFHFGKVDPQALTIRTNWAFSLFWLSPRLGEFLQHYPGLSVNIIPALWESDYQGKADSVQIRFGNVSAESDRILLTQQLYHFPVCSPAVAASINNREDLASASKIEVMGLSGQWQEFLHHNHYDLEAGYRSSVQISSPTFILALELARNGLGVALAHDLIMQDFLTSGQLVRVGDDQIPIAENYSLIHDRNHSSAIEKAFCDWLVETI